MTNEQYYQIGKQGREQGYTTMRQLDRARMIPDNATHTQMVFAEAGLMGAEMPYKVTGWRYGHIPACGRSYNGRDGFMESGVSLMAVDGGSQTEDAVSAMFIANGRPVVQVEGYLNTIKTGSDGEPLVLDAREVE